jgi:hypothetical protein
LQVEQVAFVDTAAEHSSWTQPGSRHAVVAAGVDPMTFDLKDVAGEAQLSEEREVARRDDDLFRHYCSYTAVVTIWVLG